MESWKKTPRVLIADDSSILREVFTKEITQMGISVTAAVDGQEALEVAKSTFFDMIITDIDMPNMNGFDLCINLKKYPFTKAIPVIMLSSLDSEANIEHGFKVGAAAYVSKARAGEELQECVKDILQKALFLREQTVLVVDDSPLIINIVKDGLIQAGFQVITAENGKIALEKLKTHKPDLIISDMSMPEMDGITLCSTLQADSSFSGIPFVVMSSSNDRAVMRRMIQRGACAFLVKPFNIEQVVITAEKILSDQYQLLLKEKEKSDAERNLMLASITSLIEALEARDHYTRGHSETVAEIVVGMAKKMSFPPLDIENIKIAGKLHDLGKIGIPDRILLKPGPLSKEEYLLIKKHPVIGATILEPIPTLEPIIPAVLCHHERIDGKGYPKRLKSSNIPLWARIIAVADTYHALISDRPYRESLSQENVLQLIEDVRSTQLCPECADVFLKWIQEQPRSFPASINLNNA
jgi:response regulator RpfG family c-di-GMP phosphodiesterase